MASAQSFTLRKMGCLSRWVLAAFPATLLQGLCIALQVLGGYDFGRPCFDDFQVSVHIAAINRDLAAAQFLDCMPLLLQLAKVLAEPAALSVMPPLATSDLHMLQAAGCCCSLCCVACQGLASQGTVGQAKWQCCCRLTYWHSR